MKIPWIKSLHVIGGPHYKYAWTEEIGSSIGGSYQGLWLFQEADVLVGVQLLSHIPVQPKDKFNTSESPQERQRKSSKGICARVIPGIRNL